jgi:hypothetical protein
MFIDACQRMTDFLSHGQFDGHSVEQLSVVIMSSLFGLLARVPPGEQVRATCNALIGILVKGLHFAR